MLPKANRSFRRILFPVWLVVIVILTAADGASQTVFPDDKLPRHTDASSTSAEGAAPVRRPGDLLQSRYLRFGRLTAEDGLSADQTWDLAQDNHGFMWFATANGLNRYDGSGVKVYRHDPDNPNSLSHNIARSLAVDRSGILWIGTWGGGLNQYDREKDAFIRYQHDPDNPHSLSNNVVRTVYEDRAGRLWVSTWGGLNRFDRKTETFTRYRNDPAVVGNAVVQNQYGVCSHRAACRRIPLARKND